MVRLEEETEQVMVLEKVVTVMVSELVSFAPSSSVTVSLTVYVSTFSYLWFGFL